MQEIIGIVRIQQDNVGSKSEGQYAHLVLPTGENYILYRPEVLAKDDAFFHPFNNKQVNVIGEIEPRTGFICVEEIKII